MRTQAICKSRGSSLWLKIVKRSTWAQNIQTTNTEDNHWSFQLQKYATCINQGARDCNSIVPPSWTWHEPFTWRYVDLPIFGQKQWQSLFVGPCFHCVKSVHHDPATECRWALLSMTFHGPQTGFLISHQKSWSLGTGEWSLRSLDPQVSQLTQALLNLALWTSLVFSFSCCEQLTAASLLCGMTSQCQCFVLLSTPEHDSALGIPRSHVHRQEIWHKHHQWLDPWVSAWRLPWQTVGVLQQCHICGVGFWASSIGMIINSWCDMLEANVLASWRWSQSLAWRRACFCFSMLCGLQWFNLPFFLLYSFLFLLVCFYYSIMFQGLVQQKWPNLTAIFFCFFGDCYYLLVLVDCCFNRYFFNLRLPIRLRLPRLLPLLPRLLVVATLFPLFSFSSFSCWLSPLLLVVGTSSSTSL